MQLDSTNFYWIFKIAPNNEQKDEKIDRGKQDMNGMCSYVI